MSPAQRVSLGKLLELERRPVVVEPDQEYHEIGVYCFGRGIFHKEPRTGLEVGSKKLFRIREDDLIFQVTFAWEGAVALAGADDDGLYGSTRFPTFRVDESRAVPAYLLHYFKTHDGRQQLVAISPGSAGRNRVLSLKRIPEVVVPLPLLAEQRRIVARIDDLAAKIAEAHRLREKTTEETGALRASLITHSVGGTPVEDRLASWLRAKPRNGWSCRCDNAEDGVAILRLSGVTGFEYRSTEFKRTSAATDPGAHYWLRKGDLLITRSNTPQLVGHAAIYDGEPRPCIYPDLMMRLDVDEDRADKRFVWYWLQGSMAREFIMRSAKGTSPSMKKISQKVVMSIPCPGGLALQEQRRIVTQLDATVTRLKRVVQLHADTAAELDALLPSILDKAFKGEL